VCKKTKIYIDENIPVYFAKALDILQKPLNNSQEVIEIISIKESFGKGVKDEDWIPKIAKEKGIVITQDFNIQKNKYQRELYIKSGIGIFFLKPLGKRNLTYWEMVKVIINKWEDIKQKIKQTNIPFAYKITARKIEKI